MGKTYRREISFQNGEVSPLFKGRSDTNIYEKGLDIAENVYIDKRGGAIRRTGTEHIGHTNGDFGRLFTLQVSRQQYYTLLIHAAPVPVPQFPTEMLVVAPGANLLGNNLILNSNFANAGDNWNTIVNPGTSIVNFLIGEAQLIPEQDDLELVTNPNFDQGGTGWTVRESHAQSDVTFANSQVTLTPRTVALEYAGITQNFGSGASGQQHKMIIAGNFSGNNLSVKIGNAIDDGTFFDGLISADSTLNFTPTSTPIVITLDCIFPESVITLDTVSVLQPTLKTAAIEQTVTTPDMAADHLVVVGQKSSKQLKVAIGTAPGLEDIAVLNSRHTSVSMTFTPGAANYSVSVIADGDDTDQVDVTFVGTGLSSVAPPGLGFEMPAPWTESQLPEVHVIEAPDGQTFYFLHPNVPTQKIIYSFATDSFTNLAPVNFINIPPEWAGTNWPSTGTHFQGRLWLGGTPNERQTFWGSQAGINEDFRFDDGGAPPVVVDSDAIQLTLQDFGRIEWMIGTKNLLIGSENGEHLVTSQGGVITPTDFEIEKQSAYGSNNMQGVQVGEKVFYLTPDGRQLRAMSYEWQEDNWLSQDLTFVSEHVTKGRGTLSAWAQYPNSLFYIVLQDGTLAAMTYDRSSETVAWTRIFVPGLFIFDIAVGRIDGLSQLIVIGQRNNGIIDLEISPESETDIEYLDSHVKVFDIAGTDIITGLDHLEGQLVRVIVDNAVEPQKFVVGGQVQADTVGNNLVAGIDYTSKIVTLSPDSPKDQIRSFKKRWNKVWALLLDSKLPIINGVRPPDRTPSTPMNTSEPIFTGHVKTVNLGWDDFGQVTIEQDLPVPMKVLAIYGETGVETL